MKYEAREAPREAGTVSDTPNRRVVVTWPGFRPDDPNTGGLLLEAGCKIDLAPKLGARTPEELSELVRDADATIASTDPFDASVFAAAPRLRVVARTGVGTDSIDIDAATEAGVLIATTPGANEETVADHALALILSAIRRVVEHDASVRAGDWNRAGPLTPWHLHGKTVGIIGYGTIGRAVGKRLPGFGVEVLVCDPALPAHENVGLDELLTRSDVVSIHTPLTEQTSSLIGERELALMRSDAILVNTSRGGLIDEDSLYEALSAGRLRAAGLDVFEQEPPLSSKLLELPNVVLSPHIGGLSAGSIDDMVTMATHAVLEVLNGGCPDGVVNPEAFGRHPHGR
jgi:phosphoglycerate dehydrogenase-like enzyme